MLSRITEGEHPTLDALLRGELEAHAARDGHLTLDGPTDLQLPSKAVQIFALAFHELATNAVKYGALATPAGRLCVRWRKESGNGGGPSLHVEWRESGVAISDPGSFGKQNGYGRELIEHALPYQLKAKTTYAVEADGVRCTIAAPLA